MIPTIDPNLAVADWRRNAGAPDFGLISTVATDSTGKVFVLCRSPQAMMLTFNQNGEYQGSWSEHKFVQPHGLWIGPDDRVYTTDTGDHTIRIFTTKGVLLQTIGRPGQVGAPGEPFNAPTRAVVGPSGDIFVSDGYGQNRIHRFSPGGQLLHSWGEPGSGPGQFDTPHSLWVDQQERVYVVDRANGRVQVFEGDGTFVSEWDGFRLPHDIFMTADEHVLVTDCAPRIPESTVPYHQTMPAAPILMFALDGTITGVTGFSGDSAGQFLDCPHSIWIDPFGDIYVSEVITPNRLQKFRRSDAG